MSGQIVHHSPQGTLYDLDALCALHPPGQSFMGSLTDLEITLIVALLWALIATAAAVILWTRSPT